LYLVLSNQPTAISRQPTAVSRQCEAQYLSNNHEEHEEREE
jgi:hypothetical protein